MLSYIRFTNKLLYTILNNKHEDSYCSIRRYNVTITSGHMSHTTSYTYSVDTHHHHLHIIHTSPCTHVYINWYMHMHFTNIHMYRSTIRMCVYTQRERKIIKRLVYTLWTYLSLPNSYSYPLQPSHTVQ